MMLVPVKSDLLTKKAEADDAENHICQPINSSLDQYTLLYPVMVLRSRPTFVYGMLFLRFLFQKQKQWDCFQGNSPTESNDHTNNWKTNDQIAPETMSASMLLPARNPLAFAQVKSLMASTR